ncbi:MAG TPA: deaminase, partial [Actinomycetota bacterium]
MSKVYTGASMSLDGYISGPDETGFDHLFKWYGNGDVEVRTTHPELTSRMTPVSAEYFRNIIDSAG